MSGPRKTKTGKSKAEPKLPISGEILVLLLASMQIMGFVPGDQIHAVMAALSGSAFTQAEIRRLMRGYAGEADMIAIESQDDGVAATDEDDEDDDDPEEKNKDKDKRGDHDKNDGSGSGSNSDSDDDDKRGGQGTSTEEPGNPDSNQTAQKTREPKDPAQRRPQPKKRPTKKGKNANPQKMTAQETKLLTRTEKELKRLRADDGVKGWTEDKLGKKRERKRTKAGGDEEAAKDKEDEDAGADPDTDEEEDEDPVGPRKKRRT